MISGLDTKLCKKPSIPSDKQNLKFLSEYDLTT